MKTVIKNQMYKIVRQPDAARETPQNNPGHSMPFADQIGNYQRNIGLPGDRFMNSRVFIVGSGIAGLAAAYYFMRDGQVPGANITFIEQLDVEGGSLDGSGNATQGYIIRGGREMDFTYENFWDIFQDIPALELPAPYSVLDEYRITNDSDPNFSKARLIHKQGKIKDFSKFGLSKKDQMDVVKLLLKKRDELDGLTIQDYFGDSFLASDFWTYWRTMFAFENWHSLLELKLYMHRFLHAIDGLNDMSSLVFPKYNQYDNFVVPLRNYLKGKGVNIQFNTTVYDLDIEITPTKKSVKQILTIQDGKEVAIPVSENDFVIVTTGSMTEDTFYGDSNHAPAITTTNENAGQSKGWAVWNNLAKKSPEFGRPWKFNTDVSKSSWMSATLTCKPSAFIDKLKQLSINDPYSGKSVTGGIITITDSNWLMSFTCNRQPHFPTQPDDVLVIWVYALLMDTPGNYVKKPMPQCTGHEVMAELCYHLGILPGLDNILSNTIVRTTYMPYITSMFLPRAMGDRPQIVPQGSTNLALVGQFVETNNDVVFTMESSVRTGRIAVYELLQSNKQVPDINPLQYDIRHLLKAANALNDGKGFHGEAILRKILKGTYYEHILPVHERDEKNENIIVSQWEKIKGFFVES